MSLSQAKREVLKYTEKMKKEIEADIIECCPVSCDGANIILLNDKLYFKNHVFYSFDELFDRIEINDCSYNKSTYSIY